MSTQDFDWFDFEGVVLFNKVELKRFYRTGGKDGLTTKEKRRLRKQGIIFFHRERREVYWRLTPRTLEILGLKQKEW